MKSYSAIWGHIALFILHCTMFTHVLQINVFLACSDVT